ncbi:cupin domain-containing protein [Halorientalis sp.]|uniref:cupin domain-containing protein n=1 Tax=Halorientalis sp. TaxID=1931229 RepID=UPI00263A398E|nr:cupin domain-containing protein [Halorientalis sp.]
MPYRKVEVDDLPDVPSPAREKTEIDEAVGATTFGCNLYVLDPGEPASFGYHKHPEHEELFYVLDGTLEFETEDGVWTVGANEAFFVPPNHAQQGQAIGDDPARLLAIGAPKVDDRPVFVETCSECGETGDREIEQRDGTFTLCCANCGAETGRFETT